MCVHIRIWLAFKENNLVPCCFCYCNFQVLDRWLEEQRWYKPGFLIIQLSSSKTPKQFNSHVILNSIKTQTSDTGQCFNQNSQTQTDWFPRRGSKGNYNVVSGNPTHFPNPSNSLSSITSPLSLTPFFPYVYLQFPGRQRWDKNLNAWSQPGRWST